MKKKILVFTCIIIMHFSFGQTVPPGYVILIKNAISLFRAQDYKGSANGYSEAFNKFGWKGFANDHYNAACSWAMAGYPDSAFSHLEYIAQNENFTNYLHASTDKNLEPLHASKRWQPLLDRIKSNKEKLEASLNKPLAKEVDSMFMTDVRERNVATRLKTQKANVQSIDSISRLMHASDSSNFLKLGEIFQKYGFPNYDLVGRESTFHFWVLVQHQDKHPGFQDSVSKAMKIEVDKNLAPAAEYAFLVDLVKINQGQLQVYGTQMVLNKAKTSYEPKPVIEPAKLNERRKTAGLSSIEEYIEMTNKRYSGALNKKQPDKNK